MSQQTERVTADATAAAGPASSSSTSASPAPAHPAAIPSAPVLATPTLTVGHADDPMERMADAMADRAVAHLDASEPHRHTPGCGHLRRSVAPAAAPATVGLEGGALDTDASGQIEAARGGGRALPTDVRRRMEGAFGTSLSHVRVHDGPQAAKLSASMQASAFTTGSDVFFGAGQFSPGTPDGEHVLAHELAHVVTEGTGGVRRMVIRRGLFDKVKALKAKITGSSKGKTESEAVSNSKKVEKEELKRLQGERERGMAQREKTKQDVYGDGPGAEPAQETPDERTARKKAEFATQGEQWTKVNDLKQRFDLALMLERETFEALKAQYSASGKPKEDEEIAQEAYDQVWLNHVDEELRSVRPARETAAERLVAQVRQVRAGANVQQEGIDSVAEKVKLGQMLSKTVEQAYEAMVIHARRLQRKAERAKQPLSDDDARAQSREVGVKHCEAAAKVRKHKTPRELPAAGSQIDNAAWEAAEERVDLRRAVKAKQKDDFERLQAQLGGKENWGDVAGGAGVELGATLGAGLGEAVTSGGETAAETPGKLAKIKAFFKGTKAPEEKERDDFDTPRDVFDQATDGITASGNIISSLAGAVSEALTMARHIKDAYKSKDPWEAVKATKAGLGSVDGLVKSAGHCATLAKSIEPTLSKSVASVMPGLGLVSSVIDTARASLDVAMAGRRQHETNTTLFDARARTEGNQADVLVWPLMKMSQAHTKSLENNVWTLGKSMFDLVTNIAELASAGGMGIPAAVKTGNAVIDKLHTLGHFIADEIITRQAQRAEKDSAVLHLEGGAQDELRKHPKMAVDAIILRAVHGDERAMAYVCNYWVDGKPVTPELVKRIDKVAIVPARSEINDGKIDPSKGPGDLRGSDDIVLVKIREAMLVDMNMDGDPQTAFENAMGQAKGGLEQGKGLFGLREKWKNTGEMAQLRNSHSEDEGFGHAKRSDRGFGWRVKMLLKGEEKFGRSMAKTQILKGMDEKKAAEEHARKVAAGDVLPDGVACAVGKKMLGVSPTVAETEKFFAGLSIAELEAEIAAESTRTEPRNSAGWIELMNAEIERKKEAAKSGGGAPQGQEKSRKRSNSAPPALGSSQSSAKVSS
ncbi:MAG: DUF4157 domain-containing protein [Actinomycetales bacterium]|nr:DUF4157 domain-containing protein [Actinomycetales bacterium]